MGVAADADLEDPCLPLSSLGPARQADYHALPDEPRYELIRGRLYRVPSPLLRHQRLVALLLRQLDDAAQSTGGLALPGPLDVVLADHTVVQPDLLYLSPERLRLARERVEGAPDLVVEVLSPGSVRRDRGEKLLAYAQAGVAEYWIADPGAPDLEFLINRGEAFELALPRDGVYRSPVLPAVRLDLPALWAGLLDRRRE